MAKAPNRARGRGGAGGRKAAAKPKKVLRSAPARTASIKGGYEVLCSECYSNYALNPAANSGKIVCPECMHMGEVAASDVMAQVAIAKSTEKSWLTKAIIPAGLMLVLGVIYVTLYITKSNAGEVLSDGMNYGMLGAVAILFIVSIAFTVKYETNRYDVYF